MADQSVTNTARNVISKLLWIGAIGGALYGGFDGFSSFFVAESSPQQGAAAAYAAASAVVPYVLARGWDELSR